MNNVTRLLMQGAAGAVGGGTYVDDVFSTYVYGPDSNAQGARTITTNIDYTEGALIWTKSRGTARQHMLVDTVRGVSKQIFSDSHVAESTASIPSWAINTLTETGYNIGTGSDYRDANYFGNNEKYASWNFRKAKGFFDIVTWTGNATNSSSPPRQIAHNLGSVPGAIWVKCLTANQSWACYHTSLGATRYMHLSDNGAGGTSAAWWNNTEPTSTHFTVSYDGQVNENNQQYVAYVFAGGASTAATAPSVDFDGSSSEYLSLANTSDLKPGSGDFTIEMWVKPDATADSYDFVWSYGWEQQISWYHQFASGQHGHTYFRAWFRETEGGSYVVDLNSTNKTCAPRGAWSHVAVVRNGSLFTLYVNGNAESTATHTGAIFGTTSDLPMIGQFGGTGGSSYPFKGKISNFRFTKGQALYTSNFRPSTEPLTTTSQGAIASNVKLLCCNNSSVTGSTVTPGTITANGSPTASTDSPFNDPEGFKFGEGGDQNIIKTGSFVGNGNSDGPKVNLGWEPQWVLTKNSGISDEWYIFDSMRGIVTGGYDPRLRPNSNGAESSGDQRLNLTPTGFKITSDNGDINGNGNTIIYMAIRRPDGYVGKPAEAGTDVFTTVNGANSTILEYVSNFPVDYALARRPAASENWYTSARLIQRYLFYANLDNAQQLSGSSNNQFMFDSNIGWSHTQAWGTAYQSWMWKRGAGFDVVTWSGDGVSGRQMPHSMGKTPEMMWVKRRSNSEDWTVYHIGENGGTNPEQYRLRLNMNVMNYTGTSYWNNTAPTSTHFTLGNDGAVNSNGETFIGMLFASVDGISKVGYYDGTGSTQTITTGFQPRFVILKRIDASGNWYVLDTTRGWGAGNDKHIQLNETNAQSDFDFGAPTATGFTLTVHNGYNGSGGKYIYYAHA